MTIPVTAMSNILSQIIGRTHIAVKARPGVGTTYTITQLLKNQDCEPLEMQVDEYTSGYEMVHILNENRDRTIVIHISESTFKDDRSDLEAVLKAAMDGFIQFHSSRESLSFQFSGKLIFTVYGDYLPESLRHRTVFVEFN